jgi:hypothetical protein
MVMQTLVEVFAAITMSVITASFAQFGVSVRCHAPSRPAVHQVVSRVPMRAHVLLPAAVHRRYA